MVKQKSIMIFKYCITPFTQAQIAMENIVKKLSYCSNTSSTGKVKIQNTELRLISLLTVVGLLRLLISLSTEYLLCLD